MGDFLTERGAYDTLTFVTGQSHNAHEPSTDWAAILQPGARVAVYMGVNAAPQIATALKATGIGGQLEIAVVSNAQQADQKIAQCDVDGLVETLKRNEIQNPAILFVSRSQQASKAAERPVQNISQSA